MRRLIRAAALTVVVALLPSCSDPGSPTGLDAGPALRQVGAGERIVSMMDACDPESFDAALGVGSCVRNGGVTFERFLEELGKHQKVGSWHFAPPTMNVRVGETLVAINRGGEVHTFTEVAEFGGGFVAELNHLAGTPVPAPECLNFAGIVFVPPGGTDRHAVDDAGTEKYMCCLHPWMRTTVHASAH